MIGSSIIDMPIDHPFIRSSFGDTAEAAEAMRELVARYLSNAVSRRDFVRGLIGSGLTAAAAQSVLGSIDALAQSRDGALPTPDEIKIFEGPAGAAFAEQLIASGVR